MIAIVNVTNPLTEAGPNRYEVRINSKVITKFTHNRENGLSQCLRSAARAVDERDSDLEMEAYKKFIGEKVNDEDF